MSSACERGGVNSCCNYPDFLSHSTGLRISGWGDLIGLVDFQPSVAINVVQSCATWQSSHVDPRNCSWTDFLNCPARSHGPGYYFHVCELKFEPNFGRFLLTNMHQLHQEYCWRRLPSHPHHPATMHYAKWCKLQWSFTLWCLPSLAEPIPRMIPGYETWSPIGWCASCVIGWSKFRLGDTLIHWILSNLQCIMVSWKEEEISTLFQSRLTIPLYSSNCSQFVCP